MKIRSELEKTYEATKEFVVCFGKCYLLLIGAILVGAPVGMLVIKYLFWMGQLIFKDTFGF